MIGQRVCSILGCRLPVIEGGLAYVGNGLLAAAVSRGGGFGQVGTGGRTIEDMEFQIQCALRETSAPIGVNIPISEHRDMTPVIEVVERYAGSLKAVSLSAGNPRPWIGVFHRMGLKVMTLVSTPDQAEKVAAAGADILVCEGFEAGGHNGPAELTTLSLVPSVASRVSVPVIAAGGIADGRTAAAAFCLGADGIQLGTRFVTTVECQAHANYKAKLVASRGHDTTVMERSLGRVTRVLKSPFVATILNQEKQTPGDVNTLIPLVSGSRNRVAAVDGRMDDGWVNCGQSVELIQDIPSAEVVVQQIMQEAYESLNRTLSNWHQ